MCTNNNCIRSAALITNHSVLLVLWVGWGARCKGERLERLGNGNAKKNTVTTISMLSSVLYMYSVIHSVC